MKRIALQQLPALGIGETLAIVVLPLPETPITTAIVMPVSLGFAFYRLPRHGRRNRTASPTELSRRRYGPDGNGSARTARPRALRRAPLPRSPPRRSSGPSPESSTTPEKCSRFVLRQRLRREVEQPGRHTLPRRQTSAMSGHVQVEPLVRRQLAEARPCRMSKPSAIACIMPYSMPLWIIFTKCPAPTGPAWMIALLGALIVPLAAAGALDRADAGRQRLEDRIEVASPRRYRRRSSGNSRAPAPRRRPRCRHPDSATLSPPVPCRGARRLCSRCCRHR
jgi:hypothetical protein